MILLTVTRGHSTLTEGILLVTSLRIAALAHSRDDPDDRSVLLGNDNWRGGTPRVGATNWYYNLYPITSSQGRSTCGVGTAEARLTLGNIVRKTSAGSGVYVGVIQVVVQSYASVSPTTTTGRASGVAVVSDIQLAWPKTAQ